MGGCYLIPEKPVWNELLWVCHIGTDRTLEEEVNRCFVWISCTVGSLAHLAALTLDYPIPGTLVTGRAWTMG